MTDRPLHLAVALDGAGWHPAAWREPTAQPERLFEAEYWIDQIRTLESADIDLVTIEDSFTLQTAEPFASDDRTDQVRGRLDALLIASRVAPLTSRIGLVPTVTTAHTEPFHVSTKVATLDYVSEGRAGWRAQILRLRDEGEQFGRRDLSGFTPDTLLIELEAVVEDLFSEAAESVEVARRLWDSWEDGAIIKDAATNRFIDRDRLHYIDFEGEHFSVRGPAITPRPPQGQPVVVALAHSRIPYEFAAASADIVFITPKDGAEVLRQIDEVRDAEHRVGRVGEPLRIFADLVVFLDDQASEEIDAKARLDQLAGEPLRSDALIVAGHAAQIADLLAAWSDAGLDGFRLRPGRIPHDVDHIAGALAPELRRRGLLADAGTERTTLRDRLGFDRPLSRYSTEHQESVAS